MKLYYIRHGWPSYELNKLTPRGVFEAKLTAKYLKNLGIEKVITSDSNRAIETASFLLEKINVPTESFHSLNEDVAAEYFSVCENGKFLWVFWSEKILSLMSKHQDDNWWYFSDDFSMYKMGEGYQKFVKDFDQILLSINIVHNREEKTYYSNGEHPEVVAIFAHGGMGMSFVPYLLDENYCYFCINNKHLDTCGICEFEIDLENTHKIKMISYNKLAYKEEDAQKYPNAL